MDEDTVESNRLVREWLKRRDDQDRELVEYDRKHAAAFEREREWIGVRGRRDRVRELAEADAMI